MMISTKYVLRLMVVCVLVGVTTSFSLAGTIIKLDLGGVGPDVGMNGAGVLSTVDDGHPATAGDQDTAIVYTGFLGPLFSNVTPPPAASFTLSGLQAIGPAQVPLPNLAIQSFIGGTFSLYDPANNLLLQGPLTNSALTGTIGSPGTGALFTTTLGSANAGSLAAYVLPGTLSLSMNLTTVNGGSGFFVTPPVTGGALQPFLADASVNIAGDSSGVPEPTSLILVMAGAAGCIASTRRRIR